MSGSKVLLVEDDLRQRKIMKKWLTKSGYSCIEANDGVEALEQFEKHNGDIKLVILDVMMPRMDGISLIKEIRAKAISTAPVIMCTGADPTTLESLDVFAMFTKPVDMNAFMEKVKKAFYFGQNQATIMGKVHKLSALLNSATFAI